MASPQDLDRFARMIRDASRIVAFTGAGISTESGIPDFRSPGSGLWNKMKPIEFQDFMASEDVRQESWRRRFESRDTAWDDAKPNRGHLGVAKLVEQGKCIGVITQNVDNLHQDSGIPDEHVVELHGNSRYAACLSCHARFELAGLKAQFLDRGRVDACDRCGGIIKTATISFGQAMPDEAMRRAQQMTEASDLFIVIGSSLVVHPAAGFPECASRRGARLVILNREPTPLDNIADLVLHEEIGPTMGYATGVH